MPRPPSRLARLPWLSISLVLVTVLTAWLTASRLHLSGDISALFPQSGEAAAP
jgi:hypothetical protein